MVELTSAILSMLALETAMLTSFGEEGQEAFNRIMTGISRTAVTLIVPGLALYMIVVSTKQIKCITAKKQEQMLNQLCSCSHYKYKDFNSFISAIPVLFSNPVSKG